MYNPTAPTVPLILDRHRSLLLNFMAMRAYEGQTGRCLLRPEGWTDMGLREERALLWACLRHEVPDLTEEQTGDLVTLEAMDHVKAAIARAVELALPTTTKEQGETDEAEGEPVTWLTLWSVGRHDLGLGEADFWSLTLAQFDALVTRWKSGMDRADFRAGVVAATIANVNRDAKSRPEPYTPQDFMPTTTGRMAQKQTWENQLAMIEMLNAAFGGRDMRSPKTETTAPE